MGSRHKCDQPKSFSMRVSIDLDIANGTGRKQYHFQGFSPHLLRRKSSLHPVPTQAQEVSSPFSTTMSVISSYFNP